MLKLQMPWSPAQILHVKLLILYVINIIIIIM